MILAIDVGGTKMAAGLVAPDGTVITSRRAATPQNADAETLWHTLTTLIDPLSERAEGVGVGCGGPMTWPDGEVSPLNIPGWRGFPLRARLAGRFPGLPVRLHNDAICLAIAEHWQGAGRGSADMLGMVVSTGVGGGLILGGRLVNGGTGNAGHIGHVVVEPDGGPRCGCGGHGCLEAVARGPALTTWAQSQGWTPTPNSHPTTPLSPSAPDNPSTTAGPGATFSPGAPLARSATPSSSASASPTASAIHSAKQLNAPGPSSPLDPRDGAPFPGQGRGGAEAAGQGRERGPLAGQGREGAMGAGGAAGMGLEAYQEDRAVTGRALAADALAGDPVALLAMRRAGRALGIAIASATHLCDLDLVTIGGGLSQAGEPLFGPLEEALRDHARMGFARRLKVVPAALGQEAGLVGAAALLLAGDAYWPPTRP
ncbi:ROK family protein [Nonomuraea sp. NPDC049646]|uniref:ROK family protein n=1 Tax=unclassified Nonomuraea TaxID=2593643 RepID=UPI00378983D6